MSGDNLASSWPSWERPETFPHLQRDDVHLWRADVSALAGSELQGFLNGDERARADRFLVEAPRQQFVAARGLLRRLLECYLQVPAAELRFEIATYGKP